MSLNLTGNNLIPYPYYAGDSWTTNGITYVVDENGFVTANGTATDASYFWFANSSLKKARVKAEITYTLSGCPEGGSATTYRIGSFKFGNTYDFGQGVSFTPSEDLPIVAFIRIEKGVTVENLVFKPMLNKGTKALPYEPYKSINPENIKVNMSSNLIPYPYSDSSPKTVNGITFTVNNDNSVTANGTSTATANFLCLPLSSLSLKKGEYTLSSGLSDDNTPVTYGVTFGYKYENSNRTVVSTKNGTVSIVLTENAMCDVIITVRANQTLDNLVFKPMLNKGTTALPYEKYIAPKDVEKVVVAKSPNLIPYPYRYNSLNDNGIAYTTNDNGEIIANGSIEDNAKYSQFSLNADPKIFNIQKDIYTMSCPMSLNDKSHEAQFWLDFYLDGVWKFVHSVNNTTLLTKTIDLREKEFNQVYGYVRILGKDTGTFENFTFKPMLNKGTTALPYQKYDREVVWSKTSTSDETTSDEVVDDITVLNDEGMEEEI